jgi:protein phosphatase
MTWFSRWRKTKPLPVAQKPEVSILSDKGCQRPTNEDSGAVVDVGGHAGPGRGLLIVVADGMGGHEAGEVAAQMATDTVAAIYPVANGTPGDALEEAFRQAHQNIFKRGTENQKFRGMGSTCTALAIVGQEAWAAHVGDSRLYLLRGDSIYQLSEDHSAVMEMMRQGLLTAEEAEHHEHGNLLLRAMGTQPILDMVSWPEPMDVKPEDAFLLCSDGLYHLVSDSEMIAVVRNAPTADACRKLVQMAKERGGHDNITVAIVTIPSLSTKPSQLKATRQLEVQL